MDDARRGSGAFREASLDLARWAGRAPEPHRTAALWALAVGAEIRERTRVRACRGGCLEIAVLEEGWREVLEALAPDILRRLNAGPAGAHYRRLRFLDP